jgi:hypothetical protein
MININIIDAIYNIIIIVVIDSLSAIKFKLLLFSYDSMSFLLKEYKKLNNLLLSSWESIRMI